MPRKHELLWTDLALEDLERIRREMGRAKPSAAARLAKSIRERVLSLRDFPHAGRTVPEFEQQAFRELIVAPYRIVYEVRERRVIVLRVWHGRRELRMEGLSEAGASD